MPDVYEALLAAAADAKDEFERRDEAWSAAGRDYRIAYYAAVSAHGFGFSADSCEPVFTPDEERNLAALAMIEARAWEARERARRNRAAIQEDLSSLSGRAGGR